MVRSLVLLVAALAFTPPLPAQTVPPDPDDEGEAVTDAAPATFPVQTFPVVIPLGDPEAVREVLLGQRPQVGSASVEATPPESVSALVTLKGSDARVPGSSDEREATRRRVLEALETTGSRVLRTFPDLPVLHLELDLAGLDALLAHPDVGGIELDGQVGPRLSSSLPAVAADRAIAMGIDGHGLHDSRGWSVAVFDDGTRATHTALAGALRSGSVDAGEACFTADRSCPNGQNAMIGPGAGTSCAFPGDCTHGTPVAGVAVSRPAHGRPGGVAPAAGLYSIDVFNRTGSANNSSLIAALQHVRTLVVDQDRRIAVVNMSLGDKETKYPGACDASYPAMKAAIDAVRGVGVLVVVSAGNERNVDAMSPPACISSALAVSSTDNAHRVSGFSDVSAETDIFAPGSLIEAPAASADDGYAAFSGTSFAAPHVAGAAAALYTCLEGVNADDSPPDASPGIDDLLSAYLSITESFSGPPPVRDARSGGRHVAPRLDIVHEGGRASVNDDFVDNWRLTGASGSKVRFTQCTSHEPGETLPGPTASGSVWYRWISPQPGTVSFDTCASPSPSADAVLGLYRGFAFLDGGRITLDDISLHDTSVERRVCAGAEPPVSKQVIQGETVYVQVAAVDRRSHGRFQLRWSMVATGTPAFDARAAGASSIGDSVTLGWSPNGASVTEWWLYAGATAGGREYVDTGSLGEALSATVSGLPTDGGRVHFTLWYRTDAQWRSIASVRTSVSGGPPQVLAPTQGDTLDGPDLAVRWDDNGRGATDWWVVVGSTPGGADLHSSGSLGDTDRWDVGGLPVDGRVLHLRLWHRTGTGPWRFADAGFTAALPAGGAGIVRPAAGGVLSGSVEPVTWESAASAAFEYWLYAGSEPGGRDLFDSGLLGAVDGTFVPGLPTAGAPVHLTLWYRERGVVSSWRSVRRAAVAAAGRRAVPLVEPIDGVAMDSDGDGLVRLAWNSAGLPVEQWWLYLGTEASPRLHLDTGSLASRTAGEFPLPCVAGPNAGFIATLWYRIGPYWDSTATRLTGSSCN